MIWVVQYTRIIGANENPFMGSYHYTYIFVGFEQSRDEFSIRSELKFKKNKNKF